MELLAKLVIVLLVGANVITDSIADEGRSMSFEELQEQIKINKEKCNETQAELQRLEMEIADLEKEMSNDKKKKPVDRNPYLSGILRSSLLGTYPTLCLPDRKVSGTHYIKLCNESLIVACDGKIADPGWIVIQRRIDDSLDFNRRYQEYVNGFGNIEGNFFIGLEPLHKLTSLMPHELYIHLESKSGEIKHANYKDFEIGKCYKLEKLGKYSGTAGYVLSNALRITFETINCYCRYFKALKNIWQLSSCNQREIQNNLNASKSQWQSLMANFKTVQMMIRPIMKIKYEAKKKFSFKKFFPNLDCFNFEL